MARAKTGGKGADHGTQPAGVAPTTSPVPIGLVSTDGNGTENVFNDYFDDEVDEWENVSGLLRVQTTPLNRDIVNNPGWSGTRRHLFFLETQDTIDSFPVLRTRWFDKTNVEDDINQAEFEAAHTPALGSDPQDLDTGNISFLPIRDKTFDDDTIGAVSEFITTAGDTVGIYFQNRERFLYQEFNGSTWIMNQGLPTPQIIDNASAAGLFPGRDQAAFIFPPQRLNTCDNLNRVLAFFSKTDDGDFGERRFYLRQHN